MSKTALADADIAELTYELEYAYENPCCVIDSGANTIAGFQANTQRKLDDESWFSNRYICLLLHEVVMSALESLGAL